jgi:hypothetical protein
MGSVNVKMVMSSRPVKLSRTTLIDCIGNQHKTNLQNGYDLADAVQWRRKHARVGRARRLATPLLRCGLSPLLSPSTAVDQFAQDISLASMPCGFLDHIRYNPAE